MTFRFKSNRPLPLSLPHTDLTHGLALARTTAPGPGQDPADPGLNHLDPAPTRGKSTGNSVAQ